MSDYQPGDLVNVRSASPTWWPGVVQTVDAARIIVALDTPYPTGDEWSGQTLPYGGSMPVTATTVWKASEAVAPGEHIQPRLGGA